MKLHLDQDAFNAIITNISETTNTRYDIIEKDYYITLLLSELSKKKNQNFTYFKGGTALYKALKNIQRFSEDIDLTVDISDCLNDTQARKRLKEASLNYKTLSRTDEDMKVDKNSITCKYLYDSIFQIKSEDPLQRFERVKIEATSFTTSEPLIELEIAPFLYEKASDEYKKILKEQYNVFPFCVKTISFQRIFIDKIFASEYFYERNEYSDLAKHIYDLSVMYYNNDIKILLTNKEDILNLLNFSRVEQKNRYGGISDNIKVKDFSFFNKISEIQNFESNFIQMQNVYVFSDGDKMNLVEAIKCLKDIHQKFIIYDL